MLKIKKYHQSILFFIFLLLSSCTFKTPIWIEKRPIENEFWHGIGFALKDNNNFMDIARERAIHEIASQIKININSELDIIVKDYNGSIENTISSISKSRVNLLLPELELIDTYESNVGVYYYLRLNKASYKNAMIRLKENAVSTSLDYLKEAEDNFSINSLVLIQKAYNEIIPFNDEPIDIIYRGENKNLYALIKTKSNDFHNRISINASIKNDNMITIINEDNILHFEVVDKITNNALSSIPIKLVFENIEHRFTTDENGKGKFLLPRVIYPQIYNILFQLDTEILYDNYFTNNLVLLNEFKESSMSFEIKKAKAIIRSEEKNFNKFLKNKIIEPAIKNTLKDNIDFVSGDADILLSVVSNTIKKADRVDLNFPYFAYGNVSVSLQNLTNGKQFFTSNYSNIKGADFSSIEVAGIRSYDALREIIINELQTQLILKSK